MVSGGSSGFPSFLTGSKMAGLSLFCLLTMLLAFGYSKEAPTNDLCSIECPRKMSQKFRYLPGSSYIYNYDVLTLVDFGSSSTELTPLRLRATAEFHMVTSCSFILKLKDVSLDDPDAYSHIEDLVKTLEGSDLPFAWIDGVVKHICPTADDPVWALNVRRGIISAFQNSMEYLVEQTSNVVEVDVSGKCDTNYEIADYQYGSVTIKKSKNLSTCSDRLGGKTSIQSVGYSKLDEQPVPLTLPSHTCRHVLKGGIIQRVSCEEIHQLPLFSQNGTSVTKIIQTMTHVLTKESGGKKLTNSGTVASLVFDHSEASSLPHENLDEVLSFLQDICDDVIENFDTTSPHLFSQLVEMVRSLNHVAVRTVWQHLQKSELCSNPKLKDLFVSSLPMAGTKGTVRLMAELMQMGAIGEKRAELWFTSLAFIPNPTLEIIEAAVAMVNGNSRSSLLGISSLAHSYCRQHSDCEETVPIQQLLHKLSRLLGNRCYTKKLEDQTKVIVSLKAFGNVGRAGSAGTTLAECVKDSSLSLSVRMAAIEAHRRMPCSEEVQLLLMSILRDVRQDGEIRIAAYLGIMQCPDITSIEQVKAILDSEIANQVSSFIWTHLTNLQETSAPWKQHIRSILADFSLQQKFIADIRKYSQNVEASYYSERWHMGATADVNVIYGQDSFLPRSTNFNLTINLYGQAVNLFEVGVHVKNLETMLEEKFLSSMNPSNDRIRRNAFSTDQFLKQLHNRFNYSPGAPEGSIYVKVFGNELQWFNFGDDLMNILGSRDFPDVLEKVAQHHKLEFAHGVLFLDSSLTIPTLAGLPLKLSLNGSSTVGVKYDGVANLTALSQFPKSINLEGIFCPSLSVEVVSTMAINIYTAQVGLKLTTSLSASPHLDGQISTTVGESFRFKINLPKKDVDLFRIRSAHYGIQHNREVIIFPPVSSANGVDVCTKNLLSIAGVGVCLSASNPHIFSPSAIFMGLHDARMRLKISDPSLEGFLIEGNNKKTWDEAGNLNFMEMNLLFKAPGSTLIHERSASFVFSRPNKALAFHLQSPRVAVKVSGSIIDSGAVKLFNVTANLNSKQYGLAGQVTIDRQEDRIIYGADVHALAPGGKTSLLTGFILLVHGKSIEVNFKTTKPEVKPFSLKVSVKNSSNHGMRYFESDLNLVLASLNLSLIGDVVAIEKEVSMGLYATYILDSSGAEKQLNFSSKFSNLSTTKNVKLSAISDLQSSQWPDASAQTTWVYQRFPEYLDNIIHMRYGIDRTQELNIAQTWKRQGSWFSGLISSGTLLISHPDSSQPFYEMAFTAQTEPRKSANFTLVTRLKSAKRFGSKLLLQNFTRHLMNYKAELQIETPMRIIELKEVLVEKNKQEYHGDVYFQWQKGRHSSLSYVHKDHSSKYVLSHEVDMIISKYNTKIPMKIMAALHAQNRSYEIASSLEKNGARVYAINGNYRQPNRESTMGNAKLHLPWLIGEIEIHNKPHFKAGSINVDFVGQRNVVGSYKVENMNEQADLAVEVQWDAKRNPDRKLKTVINVKGPGGQRKADVAFLLETPVRNFKGIVSYDMPIIIFNGKHFVSGKIEYAPGQEASCSCAFDIMQHAEEHSVAGNINFFSPLTDKVEIIYNRFSKYAINDKDEQFDLKLEGRKLPKSLLQYGYKLSSKKFATLLNIGHDAHFFNLATDGELQWDTNERGIQGGIRFHSSVPYIKQAVLQFVLHQIHKLGERQIYHTSTVKWNEKESHLNASYACSQLANGMSWTLSSNITLPHFPKHPQGIVLQMINEAKPFRYVIQVDSVDGEKRRSSYIYIRRNETGSNRRIQLNVPFADLQPIVFEVQETKHDFNVSKTVTINWARDQGIKWASVRMRTPTTTAFSFSIKTPFEYFAALTVQGSKSKVHSGKDKVVILIGVGLDNIHSLNVTIDILQPHRGFNAKLSVNSPVDMYRQLSATATQELGDATRLTRVTVIFGDIIVKTTLDVEYSPDGFVLNGNLMLNDDSLVQGTLMKTDKNAVDAGVHTTTYHFALRGLPVNVDSEATITRSKPGYDWTVKTCFMPQTDYCSYLQLRVFNAYDELHSRTTKEWLVKSTISNSEEKRTSGFHSTFITDPSLTHHNAKLLWNEEERLFISYSFDFTTQDDGKNAVLEVELPSRLMRVKGKCLRPLDGRSRHIQLDVQMDVTDRPDRVFMLAIESKDVASKPKEIALFHSVTIKTPDILRPLLVSSLLEANNMLPRVVSVTAELDISQDPRRKLILRSIMKSDSSDRPNYSLICAAKQDAPAPINILLEATAEQTNSTRSAVAKLSWLNRHQITRSALLQTLMDTDQKQYLVEVSSPMKSFKLEGNWSLIPVTERLFFKSESHLTVDGSLQRQFFVETCKRPGLDVKYFFMPDENGPFFHVHGAFRDHKTLQAEIDRHYGNFRVEDVSLFVKLNTSRLLHSIVKWHPGAIVEATKYTQNQIYGIQKYFVRWGELVVAEVGAELEDKSANFWEIVDFEIWPLLSIIGTNLKLAAVEVSKSVSFDEVIVNFEDLKEALSEQFDIDGIIAAYEEIRNQVLDFVASHMAELKEVIQGYIDSILKAFSSFKVIFSTFEQGLGHLASHCKEWWESTIDTIARVCESVLKMWSSWGVESALADALEKLNSSIETISQKAVQWLDAIFSFVGYYIESTVYVILRLLQLIPSWLQNTIDSVLGTSSFVRLTMDKIQKFIALVEKACLQLLDATPETGDSTLSILTSYNTSDVLKFLEYVNSVSQEIYHQMKSGEYMRRYWLNAVSYIRSFIVQLWHIDYDFEKGFVDVQFPLVMPVKSLRDLPRVISRGSYAPSKFNSLLDRFYKMKAILQSRYLLPPFPAYGVLIGAQDYITFDQRTFRFAGPCQYLLATDFYGNAFSAVVKYHSQTSGPITKSLLFIADGHHVELQASSQVLLDGQQMELPIEIETLNIERKGPKVYLYDSRGTEVICDFEADFCVLRMNGFYFGKTAGLFGTYDYEPSNDFKLPSRENTSHITQFASSWEVGRECITVKNLAPEVLIVADTPVTKLCEDLFNYHFSLFRPCYVQVNPEPYLHVCKNVVAQTNRNGLCRVAAAYMATCSYESIYLSPPPQCVTCEGVEGKSLNQGEVEQLSSSHIQRSTDIVFIVEQRNCNRHVRVDILEDLSRELEKELKAQKFHNNRYAVVGFGGHGNQHSPHVHTMNGQLFASARSVQLATKNMEFGTNGISDTFAAIQLATKLNFRPGVAKVIVLLTCSSCKEATMSSVKYSEVQQLLLDRGITMHYLNPEAVKMKVKPQVAKQIIGVDAYTIYKGKDVAQKALIGEPDLRTQVMLPRDLCIALAQEVNGSFFRSSELQSKGVAGKNFKVVLVRRIALSAQPPTCQRCECNTDNTGHGLTICRPCQTSSAIKLDHTDSYDADEDKDLKVGTS